MNNIDYATFKSLAGIYCPVCGRIMEEREFYAREIFPWVKDDSGPKLLFKICMCGYQIQIGRIDPAEFEEVKVEKYISNK